MQSAKQKDQIISEAMRILKKGGKYAIHEMSLTLQVDRRERNAIRKDLVEAIRVDATLRSEQRMERSIRKTWIRYRVRFKSTDAFITSKTFN